MNSYRNLIILYLSDFAAGRNVLPAFHFARISPREVGCTARFVTLDALGTDPASS